MDTTPLAGQVALVTGASRGLGREFAGALAEAGAAVALMSRHLEDCQRVEADLVAAGARATSVQADVTDRAELLAAQRRIEETLGPVDVLVNNAGIAFHANA